MDATNYLVEILKPVLDRRRQHLERRNDFIQIMVDHEEEVKQEQHIDSQMQRDGQQQWGYLRKSRYLF